MGCQERIWDIKGRRINPSMRPHLVKLLFHFTCRLLLQSLIELAASLNVRPVFASNDLLSMMASVHQTPNAVSAQM